MVEDYMVFKTLSDLSCDLVRGMDKIPSDIDLVVGVPRSGMLVAVLLSLYMNKPVTDLNSFLSGRMYTAGTTKNREGWVENVTQVRKALIVEDSVSSGNSILNAKGEVEAAAISCECLYLAAYVTFKSRKLVDIYFDIAEQPRVFEWNYLHHQGILPCTCMDMDGVLCDDPTEKENDDGVNYLTFIKNTKPKLIPTARIGWIVTSRLEKYRKETEYWLQVHNIDYGKLIMMDLETAEERRKLGNHAEFKATAYKNLKQSVLFVESDPNQAAKIAALTGKSVFCATTSDYYDEGRLRSCKKQLQYGIKSRVSPLVPEKIKVFIKKWINR